MFAANAAEMAGDFKSAAQIYSWVPFIPTVTTFDHTAGDTRASGYTREKENSIRNLEVLAKASMLDPHNRYIQMKRLLLQPPKERNKQIKLMERLIEGGTDGLWPAVFKHLEDTYHAIGEQEKAYRQFLWYRGYEPEDRSNQTDIYKMRRTRYVSLDEFRQEYLISGDPNQKDEFKHLPVFYAVRAGRIDLYDWLLQNGAMPPSYSLLTWAIVSKNPEMVRRILAPDSERAGFTPKWDISPQLKKIEEYRENPWIDPVVLNEMENIIRQRINQ